jgi:hypothetical protein
VWVGSRYGDVEFLAIALTAALLAHGATAPLTAAAQARGRIREIVMLKVGMLAGLAALMPALSDEGVYGLGTAVAAAMFVPSAMFCVIELRGPMRADKDPLMRTAEFAPFTVAALGALMLRLALNPSDAAAVGGAAVCFAAALLWTAHRPPSALRALFARPVRLT